MDVTPIELRAWRDRHRFTNEEAANIVALSLHGFLKQLYGKRPVNDQTARIAELFDRDATRDAPLSLGQESR